MYKHDPVAPDQPPLLGVVLCCTAILPEQRTQLAAIAAQMGATHKLDLTSDVTHLLVGSIDTPKYKYVAKERQDIKVLGVEWVDAVRASWIQGGDTDIHALERQYRLPTFYHLHICVTGFDDLAQRTAIQEAVAANGGTYHGDLTRTVTHLIAAHPSGRKYEYAGQWHLNIVSLEWLYQSLDRGMALDETLYHPLMPAEQRGKGAVSLRKPPSPVLGKRPRPTDQTAEVADGGRRKLRRSASTRLGSQSGNLWADIGNDDRQPREPPDLHASRRHDATESNQEAFPTTRAVQAADEDRSSNVSQGKSLFKDIYPAPRIFVHGFDEKRMNVLSRVLSSEAAQTISAVEMKARSPQDSEVIVIVPHSADVAASSHLYGMAAFEDLLSQGIASSSDQAVTEFWIEQCIFRHQFLPPTETPLCQPFQKIPIPGFDKLKICPTSFSGCDLLHFSKTAKLMGAKYDECLRKDTSVLVCHDTLANPGKLRYALENEIPVVSSSWFYDCVKHGACISFHGYGLSTSRQSQRESQPCFYHPVTNPRRPSTTGRSFKSDKDRPSSHGSLQPGRLTLAPAPAPEAKPTAVQPDTCSTEQDESFNTADESPGALQDLSQSRQNSQQQPSKESSEKFAKPSQRVEMMTQPKSITVEIDYFGNPALGGPAENQSLEISAEPEHSASAKPVTTQSEANTSSQSLARNANNLSNALAAVLAQRKRAASFQVKEKSEASDALSNSASRPPRKLGRALSNGSHVMSRSHSQDHLSSVANEQQDPALARVIENAIFDPELEANNNRFGSRLEAAEKTMFRPSQALSYEDPDAAAMREELLRRVNGGAVGGFAGDGQTKEQGERVESIGTVVSSAAGEDRRRRGTRRK